LLFITQLVVSELPVCKVFTGVTIKQKSQSTQV